jgi:serine/threonine protein phosphatase 1
MSFTYVIPDIHGRMDLLDEALDLVEQRDGGTVIFLGDYIDRGLASAKVVARIMAGPTSPDFTWVPIRGNHEDMLLQALEEPIDLQIWQWWHGNGGDTTMASYDGFVPDDHKDWMNNLPRLVQDTHRVYVHAGVDESYALEDQPQQVTQWFRYPSKANVGYRDQHVVHGHTPQTVGPELYANRTNLDCGAFFTGKLVVGVFDDDIAGGPIELITVGAT